MLVFTETDFADLTYPTMDAVPEVPFMESTLYFTLFTTYVFPFVTVETISLGVCVALIVAVGTVVLSGVVLLASEGLFPEANGTEVSEMLISSVGTGVTVGVVVTTGGFVATGAVGVIGSVDKA